MRLTWSNKWYHPRRSFWKNVSETKLVLENPLILTSKVVNCRLFKNMVCNSCVKCKLEFTRNPRLLVLRKINNVQIAKLVIFVKAQSVVIPFLLKSKLHNVFLKFIKSKKRKRFFKKHTMFLTLTALIERIIKLVETTTGPSKNGN